MEFLKKSSALVIALAALCVIASGCASKQWKPASTDGILGANPQGNLIMTAWGQVTVKPEKTNDDGIHFVVVVKNESVKPVKYERGFVTLLDEKGVAYTELNSKYLADNAAGTGAKAVTSGWRSISSLVGAAKVANQGRSALRNGMIEPGATHEDTVILKLVPLIVQMQR